MLRANVGTALVACALAFDVTLVFPLLILAGLVAFRVGTRTGTRNLGRAATRYGQVLHGTARTAEAVRRAIQRSRESVRALARRFGVSPTTVQRWRKRETTADAKMGPKEARSTVLTPEEEAIVVAFRRHALLPLDDCLCGLQPAIPHLTRSSLHRCPERHGIGRLPEATGDEPREQRFASYPIGYFH